MKSFWVRTLLSSRDSLSRDCVLVNTGMMSNYRLEVKSSHRDRYLRQYEHPAPGTSVV